MIGVLVKYVKYYVIFFVMSLGRGKVYWTAKSNMYVLME